MRSFCATLYKYTDLLQGYKLHSFWIL